MNLRVVVEWVVWEECGGVNIDGEKGAGSGGRVGDGGSNDGDNISGALGARMADSC